MPPRRQNQVSLKEVDIMEEDIDFLASQDTNGSDDIQEQERLRKTLEMLYAAERAKKQEQREKKFLVAAEKQLTLDIETPAKDFHNALKAVDALYSTFLIDYAAIEDRIHKKLAQIQEAQNNLTRLAKEHRKKDEEVIKTASEMHVSGLSKTRNACTAFETIIEHLLLPEVDKGAS